MGRYSSISSMALRLPSPFGARVTFKYIKRTLPQRVKWYVGHAATGKHKYCFDNQKSISSMALWLPSSSGARVTLRFWVSVCFC